MNESSSKKGAGVRTKLTRRELLGSVGAAVGGAVLGLSIEGCGSGGTAMSDARIDGVGPADVSGEGRPASSEARPTGRAFSNAFGPAFA